MRVTFTVPTGAVTWIVLADLDLGNGTRDENEEPELDLHYGECSDGRTASGLALDAELAHVGGLLALARAAVTRIRAERRAVADAARGLEMGRG